MMAENTMLGEKINGRIEEMEHLVKEWRNNQAIKNAEVLPDLLQKIVTTSWELGLTCRSCPEDMVPDILLEKTPEEPPVEYSIPV